MSMRVQSHTLRSQRACSPPGVSNPRPLSACETLLSKNKLVPLSPPLGVDYGLLECGALPLWTPADEYQRGLLTGLILATFEEPGVSLVHCSSTLPFGCILVKMPIHLLPFLGYFLRYTSVSG